MKILILPKLCHRSGAQSVSLLMVSLWVALCLVVGGGAFLWAGYEWGRQSVAADNGTDRTNELLHVLLEEQQKLLDETRQTTSNHIDALALRLGEIQSSVLRLDALGERLAEIGQLDAGEFNFSEPPARGGIETDEPLESTELSELVAEMEQLSLTLEDREQKLDLLAGLIASSKVQDDMAPRGRPVKKGWISSYYGKRTDPFSGKKAFHHGVDIAGKKDSDVIAVASGLVTHAGEKTGFGYLVEIRHADGFITKYAHNSKIFVKEGDLVTKGQVIGLMGSSGRSTGPHVHFEIARNGKTINPLKYLKK